MTTAITDPSKNPMEEFREKVLKKLRTDIGEMMPESALADLVQQAIKAEFFTPRNIPAPDRSSWSNATIEAPSWFTEEVAKLAKPMMVNLVAAHVLSHREEIEAAIKAFLEAQNLTLLTVAAMHQCTMGDIGTIARNVYDHIKNKY